MTAVVAERAPVKTGISLYVLAWWKAGGEGTHDNESPEAGGGGIPGCWKISWRSE